MKRGKRIGAEMQHATVDTDIKKVNISIKREKNEKETTAFRTGPGD